MRMKQFSFKEPKHKILTYVNTVFQHQPKQYISGWMIQNPIVFLFNMLLILLQSLLME